MEPNIELQEALRGARARTDQLFDLIDPAALYDRPIPERHRIVFYLGHLETFDWNQMNRVLGTKPLHPVFDRLFEAGIDPEPGQLPSDRPSDWPSLPEIRAYNRNVRESVDRQLAATPEDVIRMMVEHRDMHAETFAYMMHNLPHEKKSGPSEPVLSNGARVAPEFIEIPAGIATLGKRRDSGFGWDNEFVEHEFMVPAFSIAKYKVTNGEYLRYLREREGAEVPHFWKRIDDQWFFHGMFEDLPLPLDWPVWVTQDQAQRYAIWLGKRLPTEAQYHRAAYGSPSGAENQRAASEGNFDGVRWNPISVGASPAAESAFGVSELVGNGWEWTRDPFGPFDGFTPAPTYPGYSAHFFDNQHYVLKGASPLTSARLTRRSFRNWFRPEYPYVYAGFRLVEE